MSDPDTTTTAQPERGETGQVKAYLELTYADAVPGYTLTDSTGRILAKDIGTTEQHVFGLAVMEAERLGVDLRVAFMAEVPGTNTFASPNHPRGPQLPDLFGLAVKAVFRDREFANALTVVIDHMTRDAAPATEAPARG